MQNFSLASKLRPTKLSELVGQEHILVHTSAFYKSILQKTTGSLILWGPPGVGKTTLARLIGEQYGDKFFSFSAVSLSTSVLKSIATQAQSGEQELPVVIFVDELHRFNKLQQDFFLPYIEDNTILLIGATTENPSFEINKALLSRVQVYILKSLTKKNLETLYTKALSFSPGISLSPEAKEFVLDFANGDARQLYNFLELIINSSPSENTIIDEQVLRQILPALIKKFDKKGEHFYNTISCLHKSVRGSDPDASLYWLMRMLQAGTDPLYLARRMIRMAWEDIGIADPRAVRLCLDAYETYEKLGSPEGELALAGAVIFLSLAPKSNSVYKAFNKASKFVKDSPEYPVPLRFRNAVNNFMKNLGYSKNYQYPHDFDGAFVAKEQYFPDEISRQTFYEPSDRGLELKIAEKLKQIRRDTI